jgi:hypothetical protein
MMIASSIRDDSWINDPKYAAFKNAWLYASSQTRAIPAMSKITPEEAYFLFDALKRGKEMYRD